MPQKAVKRGSGSPRSKSDSALLSNSRGPAAQGGFAAQLQAASPASKADEEMEASVKVDVAKSGVGADIIESLGVTGEGPLLPEDQKRFDDVYQGVVETTKGRRQADYWDGASRKPGEAGKWAGDKAGYSNSKMQELHKKRFEDGGGGSSIVHGSAHRHIAMKAPLMGWDGKSDSGSRPEGVGRGEGFNRWGADSGRNFVAPKNDQDELVKKPAAEVEKALGFKEGQLGNGAYRYAMSYEKLQEHGLDMPRPDDMGAYKKEWVAGGRTLGGTAEGAISDMSRDEFLQKVADGTIQVSKLNLGEEGDKAEVPMDLMDMHDEFSAERKEYVKKRKREKLVSVFSGKTKEEQEEIRKNADGAILTTLLADRAEKTKFGKLQRGVVAKTKEHDQALPPGRHKKGY